jgi:hypothetical protein
MITLVSILASDVLHCDKVSWFCHIQAPTAGFVVGALLVLGDNASALQQLPIKQAQWL